jgi:cell wall-associated NlpC family hydrolase
MRKTLRLFAVALCGFITSAYADEAPPPTLQQQTSSFAMAASPAAALVSRAVGGVQATLDEALDLLGIRYKRGGTTPESGFDCSGFVRYVFNESLGLSLPHNAAAISQDGENVDRKELQPGDLVFFNTMRRAFSHVGIYLGNNQFVHAPRAGGRVRIEDMSDRYWSRRYNGARRIQP